MKNKIYTEAQFYVDGETFLKECTVVVMNMRIDYKHSFGYDLLKTIRDSILYFSLGYKTHDNKQKIELANKVCSIFDSIDIQLNLIKDINIITEKQFMHLYHHLGMLTTQINGWYNSLARRI